MLNTEIEEEDDMLMCRELWGGRPSFVPPAP